MISPLISVLKRYAALTIEEIEIIASQVELKQFRKGDMFLEEGEPSRKVGFILSGVFRFFNIDEDGKEVTLLFSKEEDFLIDIDSFHDDTPSFGSLQAETEAEVLVISKASWLQFDTQIKNWEFISKRMSQDSLIDNMKFQRRLIDQEAIESYIDFISLYPTIAQRVPAHHLASYMGITKHSLSRIRKKIASEGKS